MISRIKCALIDLSYGAILVIFGWIDSKVHMTIGGADYSDDTQLIIWIALLVSALGFVINHSVFEWLLYIFRESGSGEVIKRGPEVAIWQWALLIVFSLIVLLAVTG